MWNREAISQGCAGAKGWWIAPLLALSAFLLVPSMAQAQSASHTMIARATVAAEESYAARDAVNDAVRDRGAMRAPGRRFPGVTITDRTRPPAEPSSKSIRIITVVFTGT